METKVHGWRFSDWEWELKNIKNSRSYDWWSSSRETTWGFPGGSVVKNLPNNAEDTGSDPWSRKLPPASEQLTSGAPELQLLKPLARPVLCKKRSCQGRQPSPCREGGPRSRPWRKLRAARRTQCGQRETKINTHFFKKKDNLTGTFELWAASSEEVCVGRTFTEDDRM